MNELELIKKLSASARGESPPLVDISGTVLRAVGPRKAPAEPVLWVCGAVSLAAAAVALVAAFVQASPAPADADTLLATFSSVFTGIL
jgi:hypothetical protein